MRPDTDNRGMKFPRVSDGTARARGTRSNAMVEPMFDLAALGPERVRGLRRDEYERLIDLGVFDGERIELLRGVLVHMSPQKEPHSRITAWFLEEMILGLSRARYEVRGQSSFAATEDSVPEPDVAVYARVARRKLPRKALLVVEVADSSLREDRRIKSAIYADSGVHEYWIVNVRGRTVEVLTRPSATGYQRTKIRSAGDALRPSTLAGFELAVSDIPWTARASKRRPRPSVVGRSNA